MALVWASPLVYVGHSSTFLEFADVTFYFFWPAEAADVADNVTAHIGLKIEKNCIVFSRKKKF